MKPLALRTLEFFRWLGVDPLQTVRMIRGLPYYISNYRRFRHQWRQSQREFPLTRCLPCTGDRFHQAGTARGHYFHQDLYVAQRIFERDPKRHVDVGSRVDGFVAHVASFREIEIFDVRPLTVQIRNITSRQLDLMQPALDMAEYCDSLSCLHALEHFGLGRYGDPVDCDGYRKAWENFHQILRVGGVFYFSVPIGPQRVLFDGHRVFSIPYLRQMIDAWYDIERFVYVDDRGQLIANADLDSPEANNNFNCQYGCAIFELRKKE